MGSCHQSLNTKKKSWKHKRLNRNGRKELKGANQGRGNRKKRGPGNEWIRFSIFFLNYLTRLRALYLELLRGNVSFNNTLGESTYARQFKHLFTLYKSNKPQSYHQCILGHFYWNSAYSWKTRPVKKQATFQFLYKQTWKIDNFEIWGVLPHILTWLSKCFSPSVFAKKNFYRNRFALILLSGIFVSQRSLVIMGNMVRVF